MNDERIDVWKYLRTMFYRLFKGTCMVSMDKVEKEVKAIVSLHTSWSVEKITSTTSLEAELNLDSVELIEIIYEIEDNLDVICKDEKISDFKTVGDLIQHFFLIANA